MSATSKRRLLENSHRWPNGAVAAGSAVLALTLGLAGWVAQAPIYAQEVDETATTTACAPQIDDRLEATQFVLKRAVEIVGEAASDDVARHLLSTHTSVSQEEIASLGRPIAEVAPEAMASRMTGRSLVDVVAEVDAGGCVWSLIAAAGADPEAAYYRMAMLISAMNLHAYIAAGGLPDVDEDGIPNMRDADVDGDGLDNWQDPDVDGDEVENALDPDVDGDGLDNLLDDDVDGDFLIDTDDDDIDGDGLINKDDEDRDGDGFAGEADVFSALKGLPPWVDLDRPEGGGNGDGGGNSDGEDSDGGDSDDEDSDGASAESVNR